MIPDYRELEIRLQRHHDLLREREKDRLAEQVLRQTKPRNRQWLRHLWQVFSTMFQHRANKSGPADGMPVARDAASRQHQCLEGSQ